MKLIEIIKEEIINLLSESQSLKVYTQQRSDDFVNKGQDQPVYFSDNPNYWKSLSTQTYEAEITGNNVVNLTELQKEIGMPYDDKGFMNLEVHEDLIDAIIRHKHGEKHYSSILEAIIQYAFQKGGNKLADEIENKLHNADLFIGKEATWGEGPTTYVVMNPKQQVRLISKKPNNRLNPKYSDTTFY